MKLLVALSLVVSVGFVGRIQAQAPTPTQAPVIFITPTPDNFEVYISAALTKKGVPVSVTTNEALATLVLKATSPEETKVTTGHKVLNCMFAYCGGNEDKGTATVQILKGDIVVWSYSVNKQRGQKNKQALAEAIAKHLKDDYLKAR
jgi:hypothetical protein